MKRTNLVLNEETLEEALRLSGERTYSAAVDLALREFVRNARQRLVENRRFRFEIYFDAPDGRRIFLASFLSPRSSSAVRRTTSSRWR